MEINHTQCLSIFLSIFRRLGATALAQGDQLSIEVTQRGANRQARYGKGDIPLLLIRPKEPNKMPGSIRYDSRPAPVPIGSSKPEEPTGSYSETSYIYKSNDEGLSFTELLPKLGLSTSLFGLPSVHSSGNHHHHRPQTTYTYVSSPSSSPPMGHGPVYKVATSHESFKPSSSYSEFNSANHAPQTQTQHQHQSPKVTVKSHLHTSINGDPSFTLNNNNVGKQSYASSSNKAHSTSSFNKLPNYHFPSSSSSSSGASPSTGIVEEIVVGKPVGSIRPSLHHHQQHISQSELVINPSEYSQSSGSPYEPYPLPGHQETTETKSPGNPDGIHSSQSDHKFGHITTNYYIPHTIHSEAEYKKPFTPSPQVEYFVPQESHDGHEQAKQNNPFLNHYVPSEEAKYKQREEEQRIEYHTEATKTEDYFLPKLHPTYTAPTYKAPTYKAPTFSAPTVISPSPSVGHSDNLVYQENPSFTSYFKFGTKIADSKKSDPRPHSFPRTEAALSYGSLFKPKPESQFNAFPTTTTEGKATAAKTYYTIKEEAIDYNPYKSAPIALLKPQYSNSEIKDFGAKYQAIAQKPSIIHREFSTKNEAENFVKNQIRNAASPAVATIEQVRPSKFRYLPSSTPASVTSEAQNSVHYPDAIYIKGKFPKVPKYSYTNVASEHVKPVVEPSQSGEGIYSLPDTPQFDNAHLDLGIAGSDNTGSYVEPARTAVLRPSIELKQTIASKKISTDSASSLTIAATNSQEGEIDMTTMQSNEEKAVTNPNNHRDGQMTNHALHPNPKEQTPNQHHHPARPATQQQQPRRRNPNKNNNNQNSLQKSSHSANQAKNPSVDTVSEKSSTVQTGERKRRLNPRQKMIACERQCIQSSVSQEYDPVCGNDGKTYSNKGKLQCTQKCGKEGE